MQLISPVRKENIFISLPTCCWTCSSPGDEWLSEYYGKQRNYHKAPRLHCRAPRAVAETVRQTERQNNHLPQGWEGAWYLHWVRKNGNRKLRLWQLKPGLLWPCRMHGGPRCTWGPRRCTFRKHHTTRKILTGALQSYLVSTRG